MTTGPHMNDIVENNEMDEEFEENELIDMEGENVVEILGEDDLPPSDDSDDDNAEGMEEDMGGENNEITPERDDAVLILKGHTDAVFTVKVSDSIAVSGGCDDMAIIWNTETGDVLHKLEKHTDSVITVDISSDKQYCATGGLDGAVYIWNIKTGEFIAECEGCTEVEWVQFHPRGPVILAGSTDGNVWMWKALTGTYMNVFTYHSETVSTGGFSPCGKVLTSAGVDGNMIVWNPKTAEPLQRMVQGVAEWHEAPIVSFAFSSNSLLSVTGDQQGDVKVTQLKTGKVVASLVGYHQESVEGVGFSSEQVNMIASGSMDGKLCIWNGQDFTVRCTCPHPDGVLQVKWHPTLPKVYTACLDGIVRVWDARNGNCEAELQGHTNTILGLELGDNNTVYTPSDDFTIRKFVC